MVHKNELRFLPEVEAVLEKLAGHKSSHRRFLDAVASLGDFEGRANSDCRKNRKYFEYREFEQNSRKLIVFVGPSIAIPVRQIDLFCIVFRQDDGAMLVLDHYDCSTIANYEHALTDAFLKTQSRSDLNSLLDG